MKVGMYLGDLHACDICGKKRSTGNHERCAQLRKLKFATTNAKRRKTK